MDKHGTGGRLEWIDALKGIAILAVIVIHYLYLYSYPVTVWTKHLFFPVPWFIFLAGISSFLSFSKTDGPFLRRAGKFYRKRLPLVAVYLASTAFFTFATPGAYLGIRSLYYHTVLFDVQPPMYYFYILFSLYALYPFIHVPLTRIRSVWIFVSFLLLLSAAGYWLSLIGRNDFPWITYPWKMVLGGTYLPVYALGAAFMARLPRIRQYLPLTALPLLAAYEVLMFRTGGTFITDEPLYHRLVWSVAGLVSAYLAVPYLPMPAGKFFGMLGRHSLTLFIFHEWLFWVFRQIPNLYVHPVIVIAANIAILIAAAKAAHACTGPVRPMLHWNYGKAATAKA